MLDDLNKRIKNNAPNINSLKGFEIICEAMVYKILDIFGKNALLSMLFQIGAGPGTQISERLKRFYGKENFEKARKITIDYVLEKLKCGENLEELHLFSAREGFKDPCQKGLARGAPEAIHERAPEHEAVRAHVKHGFFGSQFRHTVYA